MPLPKPRQDETQDEFLDRAMGNPTMVDDFPEREQRYAVAQDLWSGRGTHKFNSTRAPLYVSRRLLNPELLLAWARGQGIPNLIAPEDMHVTVLYSREPLDWHIAGTSQTEVVVAPGGARWVAQLGEGALALCFRSPEIEARHRHFIEAGGSHDWPQYTAHVTLSYSEEILDPSRIEPFDGLLVFGPERYKSIGEGWLGVKGELDGSALDKEAKNFSPPKGVREAAQRGLDLRREYGRGGTSIGIARARDLSNGKNVSLETVRRMHAFFERHEENKNTPPEEGNGKIAWLLWGGDAGRRWARGIVNREVTKASDEKMIVYGWFSVIEKDGEPVRDSQGDIISENDLIEMAHDFMRESRRGMVMHYGPVVADVVESIMLTRDVQKALGIHLDRAGWFGAMRYRDRETWERDKALGFTGFSWGGTGRRERIG